MQIPRIQKVLHLKDCLIKSSSSLSSVRTQFALFHSTPISSEKRQNQWDIDSKRGRQPSKKEFMKYETRQKRADAKKALKILLYNSGSSRISFQDDDKIWKIDRPNIGHSEEEDHSDISDNDTSSKKDRSSRQAGKANCKRLRRKLRQGYLSDEFADDMHEKVFQATFGNRSYTWSFKPGPGPNFSSNPSGFEWRDSQNWSNTSNKESTSETDSKNERCSVGSFSDRKTLGLPERGRLKLEDVKNAFRSSALKWHPDKHPGPSQAMAEEKFKLCVNAYNSLRTAVSAV